MAGLVRLRPELLSRRITKDVENSNPVFSEFHRILWCGTYKAKLRLRFFIAV